MCRCDRMPIFLFNYNDRLMHGIFRATSEGELEINPHGEPAADQHLIRDATDDISRVRVMPRRILPSCACSMDWHGAPEDAIPCASQGGAVQNVPAHPRAVGVAKQISMLARCCSATVPPFFNASKFLRL